MRACVRACACVFVCACVCACACMCVWCVCVWCVCGVCVEREVSVTYSMYSMYMAELLTYGLDSLVQKAP